MRGMYLVRPSSVTRDSPPAAFANPCGEQSAKVDHTSENNERRGPRVTLLGSGPILREVPRATYSTRTGRSPQMFGALRVFQSYGARV